MLKSFLKIIFILCFLSFNSFADSNENYINKNYDAAFRDAYLNIHTDKNPANQIDYVILGKILSQGLGSSKVDLNKSREYLDIAIEMGNTEAALYLAKEYESGVFFPKSFELSLKYFNKAREMGITNLEEKIIILSQNLGQDSCPFILQEASNGDINYYFSAINCIKNESLDVAEYNYLFEYFFINYEKDNAEAIIEILSDKNNQIYNPSYAIQLIYKLNLNSTDRNQLINFALTEQFNDLNDIEFSKTLEIIISEYSKNINIKEDLTLALKLGLSSHNLKVSENTENILFSRIKNLMPEDDFFEVSLNIFTDANDNSQTKDNLLKWFSEYENKFFLNNSEDINLLVSRAKNLSELGYCSPSLIIYEKGDFEDASKIIDYLIGTSVDCYIGDLTELSRIYQNFPRDNSNSIMSFFKNQCSNNFKNSCYALGILYKTNTGNILNKKDALEMSLEPFNFALRYGSNDALLELAEINFELNRKDLAINYARQAYNEGYIGGKFLEAKFELSKFFSSKKACKILDKFLIEAPINNQYFDEAKLLHNKKC